MRVEQLGESIPKEDGKAYAVHTGNFERVEAGGAIATVDGNDIVADEPFYPILTSETGYDRQLGYAAEQIDLLKN